MTERLIARLRAARRSRRRRLAVAVTALALVAVAASAAVISDRDSGSSRETVPVTAMNPRTGVTARLGLRPASWGTAIRVRLRGVPPGTRCRLIVTSRRGQREIAGTWRATYDGTADVQTATAIPRDQLASFAVVTAGGRPLLRIPVRD
jgi:hypothetical protein